VGHNGDPLIRGMGIQRRLCRYCKVFVCLILSKNPEWDRVRSARHISVLQEWIRDFGKRVDFLKKEKKATSEAAQKDIAIGLVKSNTLDIACRIDGVIGKLWDGGVESSLRMPCNRVVI